MLTLNDRWEAMTTQEQDAVRALHAVLAQAKGHPEHYEDAAQVIEDIEFTLQGLWKFNRDVNFHTHWIDIKGCTCPKLDNIEHWGTGRITVSDCPFHWVEPKPKTYVVALVSSSCDHYLDTFRVKHPSDLVDAMKQHYGDEFYHMDQVDITSPDGGQAGRAERAVRQAIEEGEDE